MPAVIKESALKALERLPDDNFLGHGDFHPDQIIMSPKGPIIIDWITATKGSPASDVAQNSLILRLGAPPVGRASDWLINLARSYAHFRYLRRNLKNSPIARQAIDDWRIPVALDRLGTDIPSMERMDAFCYIAATRSCSVESCLDWVVQSCSSRTFAIVDLDQPALL